MYRESADDVDPSPLANESAHLLVSWERFTETMKSRASRQF